MDFALSITIFRHVVKNYTSTSVVKCDKDDVVEVGRARVPSDVVEVARARVPSTDPDGQGAPD
jgi:hypothetical protein